MAGYLADKNARHETGVRAKARDRVERAGGANGGGIGDGRNRSG